MTKVQAAIEIPLLALFLGAVTAVCIVGQVPTDNALIALSLVGLSYIVLLFNRQDPNRLIDHHLHPYFLSF